jgi:hypothetical protein
VEGARGRSLMVEIRKALWRPHWKPGLFCRYQVMPKLLTCGNPQLEPAAIHSRQAVPFKVYWRCHRKGR